VPEGPQSGLSGLRDTRTGAQNGSHPPTNKPAELFCASRTYFFSSVFSPRGASALPMHTRFSQGALDI
jgi:hypothetical protein